MRLSRSDGRWALVVSVLALALLGWGLLTRGPLPDGTFESAEPPPSDDVMIDLNRAGAPQLETLPRIGPTLAHRIVRQRLVDGPYRTVDALARVSGIGPDTLQRLRPHVQTCGPLGCQ